MYLICPRIIVSFCFFKWENYIKNQGSFSIGNIKISIVSALPWKWTSNVHKINQHQYARK